jgi:uncharacterized membrane-anchored protein YitT (DUF2179 family)
VKLDRRIIKREIHDDFFILIGIFLYAFGWVGFFLQAQITTGGITGLGALVSYATNTPSMMPIVYFGINAVLLIFSVKFFGFKFSLKTICCVIIMTFLLSFLQTIIKEPIIDQSEGFMSCVIGGVLCGMGIGLVINYKGSTGGTDIIALLINKFYHLSVGKAMLITDLLIISSSYFIFHAIDKIVFGLVAMAVSSYTVDMVINGARQSEQFMIFSQKYDQIATEINKLHRGCTVVDGIGWYTKSHQKVLIVMVRKNEAITIMRIINDIDPNAFFSQNSVRGVYGEGFQEIKR